MSEEAKNIKVVIVGNGFGGTYTLRELHKHFHAHKKVELTLVGEKNYFLFTPLLHEVATGGINPENIIEPIRKVLGCCLDKFYLGTVKEINTETQKIKVGADTIPYDYLVLAPGSETNFYNIAGASKHAFTLKSLEDAIAIKNRIVAQLERAAHTPDEAKRRRMLSFVIVGGGPSGVELAAELRELIYYTFSRYYPNALIKDASVTLVQRDKELLPQFGPAIRQKSLAVLRKKSITVLLDTAVQEVGSASVSLSSGATIESETVIWVAGIMPKKLFFTTPVAESPDGRMMVNRFLQLENHPNIFALGDGAYFPVGEHGSLPALAQVAEKQAKAVAKNLKILLNSSTAQQAVEPFTYKSSGSLVSLGQWMAAGEIAHITFTGRLTWWLWRTVYLSKMISFRKKLKVAIDWTMNLFSPRDISQI